MSQDRQDPDSMARGSPVTKLSTFCHVLSRWRVGREEGLSTSAAACMLRLAHCSRLHCGNGRSMLQGNFFVDKVSMSYTVLWNAY